MTSEGVPVLRRGDRVVGAWPEQGVEFSVRRGTFTLPRGLRDDDPIEFTRAFASRMPPAELGKPIISARAEGDREVITWRIIRVVAA